MNDLTLICETCTFPIAPGDGSIYVRTGDITAYQKAAKTWEDAHPGDEPFDINELADWPNPIRWRTGHDGCRDDRHEPCYDIDSGALRTWPHLARWTAHLMEKNWLGDSDWDDLLREVSGEIVPRRIRVAARKAA